MKAILFVVDGLRPDALSPSVTPVVASLMRAGACTLTARTVSPSVTLPCHASLFFSAPPVVHDVLTNVWPGHRPLAPGLIDLLRSAGLRCAAVFNWEQLRHLWAPGAVAGSIFLANCKETDGDQRLADLAIPWLAHAGHDFVFYYLGCTDEAGHAHGWMSDGYLNVLSRADTVIGQLLDSIPGQPAVFVASDHGGHERIHGTDCPEDMTVPLIVAGAPRFQSGCDIHGPVTIIDVAPTIAAALGIAAPSGWLGRDLATLPSSY